MSNPVVPALLLILASGLSLVGCSEQTPPPTGAGEAAPPMVAAAVTDLRDGQTGDPAPAPAPAPAGPAAKVDTAAKDTREIEWDALIPDDYRPDKLMEEFQVEDLADDDPRAAEFMERLKALWDEAPVREDLDGAAVRLPGFVVPVEADENETTGFLLVPYYGACVHVPPPPANQTVYVIAEAGKGAKPGLFDVVWVTGTISVSRIENDIAEAGYTLYASEISPYE